MSKKIFRSIWLAALIVLVHSLVLIMGVLYSYFTGVQQKQLRMGAEVVAQGVTLDGKEFFDGLLQKTTALHGSTLMAPSSTITKVMPAVWKIT